MIHTIDLVLQGPYHLLWKVTKCRPQKTPDGICSRDYGSQSPEWDTVQTAEHLPSTPSISEMGAGGGEKEIKKKKKDCSLMFLFDNG